MILGTAVIVFSVATALMGAATEYWHLVVLRMMYAAGYVVKLCEITSYTRLRCDITQPRT